MAVGVFGLQVAYKLKRTELLSLEDTHGWFGGYGTTTRMDFSNDSISGLVRGGLSVSANKMAATGNTNYGWFGGGYTGPSAFAGTPISTVNRIDFSNDSATASVRGPLTRARRNSAATGNTNYGWFGGGYTSETPNGPQSVVDRINFSNDVSVASPRGALSLGRWSLAATGNSNYGWFGAGMVGGVTNFPPAGPAHSTVQRIDFSNDNTLTSVRGPLSIPLSASRYNQWAATGNSNFGWFGGGYDSSVARIDFANDSEISLTRGPFSRSRGFSSLSATGNSNYGWFFDGLTPSVAERIDFSNDLSRASLRGGSLAFSNSATSGQAKSSSIRLQKTGNFGWFGGGVGPSTVDRINFSNDSATASVRGPLSTVRDYLTATGNNNYGWFCGGSGPQSRVDRIDFSNDSATASVRGSLIAARYGSSSVSNSNYGWVGKGAVSGNTTTSLFRIDFSNDLNISQERTPFPTFRFYVAATGNSNFGWFGAGATGGFSYNTVERVDFSNDNISPLNRGPINATNRHAATGNSNYGWFAGGFAGGYSKGVERIDFANDSVASSPRGFLSDFKADIAATGNSNYGWFGGGYFSSTFSVVDRVVFANDSVTASPRGPLSIVRQRMAATSNTPIG